MTLYADREYRFLDTEADRQALIHDMHRVREAVIAIAEATPPELHEVPRYHGWSLAAMLAHLHMIDNLALLQIKAALVGLSPSFSPALRDSLNDFAAKLFQRRLVPTTIKGIRQNEKRLAEFIFTLPVEQFSKRVYHPSSNSYFTVERALQAYFVFHWEEHLATLERGEDQPDAPSSAETEL